MNDEQLRKAERLISRGHQANADGKPADALRLFRKAHRLQVAWLQSVSTALGSEDTVPAAAAVAAPTVAAGFAAETVRDSPLSVADLCSSHGRRRTATRGGSSARERKQDDHERSSWPLDNAQEACGQPHSPPSFHRVSTFRRRSSKDGSAVGRRRDENARPTRDRTRRRSNLNQDPGRGSDRDASWPTEYDTAKSQELYQESVNRLDQMRLRLTASLRVSDLRISDRAQASRDRLRMRSDNGSRSPAARRDPGMAHHTPPAKAPRFRSPGPSRALSVTTPDSRRSTPGSHRGSPLSSLSSPPARTKTERELKRRLKEKETHIRMLTTQLEAHGDQAITEVVPLDEARANLRESLRMLMEGEGDVDAVQLEFDKWDRFINNHPEHLALLAQEAQAWIDLHTPINAAALRQTRSFVPPNIWNIDLQQLSQELPPPLARRIWDRKVLWLVRAPSETIARMHAADLSMKYDIRGLDVVELRAVYACVPEKFENDSDERKSMWRQDLLDRLKQLVEQQDRGQLPAALQRHPAYSGDGSDETGPFDPDAEPERVQAVSSDAFGSSDLQSIQSLCTTGGGIVARRNSISVIEGIFARNDDAAAGAAASAPVKRPAVARRRSTLGTDGATELPKVDVMKELSARLASKRLAEEGPTENAAFPGPVSISPTADDTSHAPSLPSPPPGSLASSGETSPRASPPPAPQVQSRQGQLRDGANNGSLMAELMQRASSRSASTSSS